MYLSVAGRCLLGRCEDTYVHDGDGLLAGRTEVLDHVLNEHRALSDLALCSKESVKCAAQERVGMEAHTGDDLNAIAGDKLDALLALGRHAGAGNGV